MAAEAGNLRVLRASCMWTGGRDCGRELPQRVDWTAKGQTPSKPGPQQAGPFPLHHKLLLFFKINLFIVLFYFIYLLFLAALGLCCCAQASLVAASGGYSSLWRTGFSFWWLLLLRSTGSMCTGSAVVACEISSCGSRALEHRLSSCSARA